jgi:hypothetical protein
MERASLVERAYDGHFQQTSKSLQCLIVNMLNIHTWTFKQVDRVLVATQHGHTKPSDATTIASCIYSYLRAVYHDCPNAVVLCEDTKPRTEAKRLMLASMKQALRASPLDAGASATPTPRPKTPPPCSPKTPPHDVCREWLHGHGSRAEQLVIDACCQHSGDAKWEALADAYLLGYAALHDETRDRFGDAVAHAVPPQPVRKRSQSQTIEPTPACMEYIPRIVSTSPPLPNQDDAQSESEAAACSEASPPKRRKITADGYTRLCVGESSDSSDDDATSVTSVYSNESQCALLQKYTS